ncbi:MAG: hypothetical protein HZB92_03290 [Euryarchaeota archaeon]|nr:hypothetical protein [Euryarchaeota archaeon]
MFQGDAFMVLKLNHPESKENILKNKLRNKSRVLNHLPLIRKNVNNIRRGKMIGIGLIEFHCTDYCDLNCFYCTYRSRDPFHFPYNKLNKILDLNPKGIVISGGGEPTLYPSGRHSFADLINYFKVKNKDIKLGLTTNGAFVPRGDWKKNLSWIRISIDASTENTFKSLKDGEYQTRMNTLLEYLCEPIPYVGVGFVYNRFNITEIASFIEKIFYFVSNNLGTAYLDKLNIQFRPCCPIQSCICPSPRYHEYSILMTPDMLTWWRNSMKEEIRRIETLRKHKLIKNFIDKNTNFWELLVVSKIKTMPKFNNCYLSLIRFLIRANGNIYPCVMKASNKTPPIGNLLKDDLGMINHRQKGFYRLDSTLCLGATSCCRLDGIKNSIIEAHYTLSRTYSIEDMDPFF